MNDRLYYKDAYIKEFHTTAIKTGKSSDGRPFIVLKETAFYPTGGGQPNDTGTLNGVEVTDVEEVEGEIRHLLAEPLPEGQYDVKGIIDWNRRFDHMQQHLGQHILSAAFVESFDARTVGFHLGTETVTIDLDSSEMTEDMLHGVEMLANKIVADNRKVEARFVSDDELSSYPLRKPPKVTENIRLVIVPDFDYNPCGGTHPATTSEVGIIKILSWEKHKSGVRVEFVCGLRALKRFDMEHAILRKLKHQLTASETELVDKVDRVLREKHENEKTLQFYQTKMMEIEGDELVRLASKVGDVSVVTMIGSGRPIQDLQKLGQFITSKNDNVVIFLLAENEKLQMVFGRGKDVNVDMNRLLKAILAKIDGKGGGTPMMAQGGGNSSVPPKQLLSEAMDLFQSTLASAVNNGG